MIFKNCIFVYSLAIVINKALLKFYACEVVNSSMIVVPQGHFRFVIPQGYFQIVMLINSQTVCGRCERSVAIHTQSLSTYWTAAVASSLAMTSRKPFFIKPFSSLSDFFIFLFFFQSPTKEKKNEAKRKENTARTM